MNKHVTRTICIAVVSIVVIGSCNNGDGGRSVTVSPIVPSDISGGAPNADLLQAALFAWQEFIALNWPAKSGVRDTPDTDAIFGDTSFEGPVVWETYRHKVEIYPGMGDNPAGFVNDAAQSFGYDTPPMYVYGEGVVEPCEGQVIPLLPAFANLGELTQIGLNFAFAGAAPSQSDTNNDPQLVRYQAKANRVHYEYVVEPVNSFWNHSQAYMDAVANFKQVTEGNGTPSTLPGPVIDFPSGMIEIKTAFRELTEEEKNSGRFFTTTVRYYEQDDSDPNSACFREAVWGLVSMHIIQKTPTAPTFVYATYEQADALLTPQGQPVEDENGNIINSFSPTSTTPDLSYMDGDPPALEIVGDEFCTDIGKRLYYQEVGPKLFGLDSGLPFEGEICQNERSRPIPPPIIKANELAHEAINNYNMENGLDSSPWLFYKLINVQYVPFDITEIEADPNSNKNEATFYLNDIHIEIDFSLQSFSGTLYFPATPAGPPTNFPPNFDSFDPTRQTFQNVLTFDEQGNLLKTYNVGGCMGCHGVAQSKGDDFSFILRGGRVVDGPEASGVTTPGATNPAPND